MTYSAKLLSTPLDHQMVDVIKNVRAAMPEWIRLRDEHLSHAREFEKKINAGQMMIAAFETDAPALDEPDDAPDLFGESGTRAQRGLVHEHVAHVMADGRPRVSTVLQDHVEERFGHKYGIASIYRALKKGADDGRYESADGLWRLKK